VRTSFSGRHIAARRCGGRGTGAVMATGSYEGSLSVEGSSGCHEPLPVTGWWSRRPWRLPPTGKAITLARAKAEGDAKALRHPAERGRGDRGVRGSIGKAGAVGRQRPRSELTHAVGRRCTNPGAFMAARAQHRSAEAFSSVVKHSVPRKITWSPRLRGVSAR